MLDTLYERIGGSARINATLEIFYRRVLTDDRLSQFFIDIDMKHLQGRQSMFLSMLLGGKVVYTRARLRGAHAGARSQGMDDTHFDAVIQHFREALQEARVSPGVVNETIALLENTRTEVLDRA